MGAVADDPRLRIHVAPRGGGSGWVRNVGVARARIAFLDDDEMLSDRLSRQLDTEAASKVAYPLVLCRSIVRTGTGDAVLPEMLPASGEHISDYILVKKRSAFHQPRLRSKNLLKAVPLCRVTRTGLRC